MKPIAAFILSSQWSGSTWLNLVLGSCSWAIDAGELRYWFTQDPRRPPCRHCASEGRPRCRIFWGIHRARPEHSIPTIAERSGRQVVVDCSKQTKWVNLFHRHKEVDIRIVHLVRNPLAVADSETRRLPQYGDTDLLARWAERHRRFDDFTASTGLPVYLVRYEDLTSNPNEHFPMLCEFIDAGPWEPRAINYWEQPHHCISTNGAASLCHPGEDGFLTRDDAWYAERAQQQLATDERWRARLPDSRIRALQNEPYALEMATRLGVEGWL